MTIYKINDIYPTIQGEGVLTGIPMILIRTQGCPVGCRFCDTKETWDVSGIHRETKFADALGTNEKWADVSVRDLVNYCVHIASGETWILLTGGEPAMQELGDLVKALSSAGFKVALETSGTADLDSVASAYLDWVCVSPKIDQPGGRQIKGQVIARADEIKYVVGKESDIELLKEKLKEWKLKAETQILLQPISMSEKATQLCMEAATRNGWRISIQTHKILSIR